MAIFRFYRYHSKVLIPAVNSLKEKPHLHCIQGSYLEF